MYFILRVLVTLWVVVYTFRYGKMVWLDGHKGSGIGVFILIAVEVMLAYMVEMKVFGT